MIKIMFLVLFVSNVFAEVGCFPESDLRYSKNNKSLEGISKAELDLLINRFKNNFEVGTKKIIVNNLWDNDLVDANATRDENLNIVININGGLVRHPKMTRDAALLVLCHELGHHLGGAPKAFRGNTNIRGWSSAEGEADYFATTKCLPKIFNDGNDTKNLDQEIDTLNLKQAMNKCKDDLCIRIALAGKSLSDIFSSLKQSSVPPSIASTEKTVAEKTIYTHPNAQCRLDTYLAGARCDVSYDVMIDNVDPRIGACSQNSMGARPTCWYKEADF